jgi:protoheme IX farnesyltransferase
MLAPLANPTPATELEPAETGRRPRALAVGRRGLLALHLELSKARLSALVVLTAVAGYVMGSVPGSFDWIRLGLTAAGTALAAAGANALNQLVETRRDALMRRTRLRPLPAGMLRPAHALVFAMLAAYGGVAVLGLFVNLLSSALALATILLYVLVYTPLKTRTTLNTLVGAVCGAIPPVIGWVAAAGRVDAGGWVLAALLFLWQIPHFFALAWMYRADYERGGFAMLPVVDRGGRLTGQVALVTSLGLVPVALSATLFGLAGPFYAAGALALGLWLAAAGARLWATRSDASARRLFLTSVIYLPALLCLMIADRRPSVAGLPFPAVSGAAAQAGPP